MRTLAYLAIGLLTACAPEFSQPSDACTQNVPGSVGASDDTVNTVRQINCYRRFVGLKPTHADAELSASTSLHSQYLQANYTDGDDPFAEVEGFPYFTGVDMVARAEFQGFGFVVDGSFELLEIALPKRHADQPAADIINDWIDQPWLRQHVLQPSMIVAGMGTTDSWSVFTAGFWFPGDEALTKPVSYPAEGQLGVPPEWVSPYDIGLEGSEIPALVQGVTYGYPITLTVGGFGEGEAFNVDPYKVVLKPGAELRAQDGAGTLIDMVVFTPTNSGNFYTSTVAFHPLEPLAPNTKYTLTAAMSWDSGESDVLLSFTTGE